MVADTHRQWVRDVLAALAAEAGIPDADALAARLILLYDAAMVGAQFDPGGLAPASARDAARTLVEAAAGAASAANDTALVRQAES